MKTLAISLVATLIMTNPVLMTPKIYVEIAETEDQYIFLGDSRTVGMDMVIEEDDNINFVAEVGKGYTWFKETGLQEVNNIMNENSDANWHIISNLGVNDLHNADKYIKLYQELLESDWEDVDFVFETVNPVDESKCKTVTNKMIKDFNKKLTKEFTSIDTYNEIYDSFYAGDGLHYDKSTYQNIYDFCLESLTD